MLCPICKLPLDPSILGCARCSTNAQPRGPESIMKEAVTQAALALMRTERVPETYRAQRVHEVLDAGQTHDALALELTNALRRAFGIAEKSILDPDSISPESIAERARR